MSKVSNLKSIHFDDMKEELIDQATQVLKDGWKGHSKRFDWLASFYSFQINSYGDVTVLENAVKEVIRIHRETYSMEQKESDMNLLVRNIVAAPRAEDAENDVAAADEDDVIENAAEVVQDAAEDEDDVVENVEDGAADEDDVAAADEDDVIENAAEVVQDAAEDEDDVVENAAEVVQDAAEDKDDVVEYVAEVVQDAAEDEDDVAAAADAAGVVDDVDTSDVASSSPFPRAASSSSVAPVSRASSPSVTPVLRATIASSLSPITDGDNSSLSSPDDVSSSYVPTTSRNRKRSHDVAAQQDVPLVL
jgi:predicted phage tail protein